MALIDSPHHTAAPPSRHAAKAGQAVWEGDCLNLMATLPDRSVDVVVTSPPYNLGIRYSGYDDALPAKAYLDWMRRVGRALHRVLRDDGSFFLNVGGSNRDPWTPMDVAQALRKDFELQNHIIWVKSISIGDDTSGHFKPISSDRFLNHNFEHVFHFSKTGKSFIDRLAIGVPFKDKSNIRRWGHQRDRRCRGNTWFIPYKTVQSKTQKFNHPCTFPVELAEQCLRLHGCDDAVVLDPFLGTGSTLVAAKRLGMSGIGMELDAGYAQTARLRIEGDDAAES